MQSQAQRLLSLFPTIVLAGWNESIHPILALACLRFTLSSRAGFASVLAE